MKSITTRREMIMGAGALLGGGAFASPVRSVLGPGKHNPEIMGVIELFSGKFQSAEEVGEDYLIFPKNIGYRSNYGPRPDNVTVEVCGYVANSKILMGVNVNFPAVWNLQGNGYGYYGGKAFSEDSKWNGDGWKDWYNSITNRATIRMSCDGTTTTLSIKDGTSSRSYAQGFGNITVLGFSTGNNILLDKDRRIHSVRIYNRNCERFDLP